MRQPKPTHRKTRAPSCRQTNLYADRYYSHHQTGVAFLPDGFAEWYQKRHSCSLKKNMPISGIIKFLWHNRYTTHFRICKCFQLILCVNSHHPPPPPKSLHALCASTIFTALYINLCLVPTCNLSHSFPHPHGMAEQSG